MMHRGPKDVEPGLQKKGQLKESRHKKVGKEQTKKGNTFRGGERCDFGWEKRRP